MGATWGVSARLSEVHVVPTDPVLDRDEQFVIESYFILIPNHPRLKTERRVKKDLHSIQSDFNFS